MKTIDRGTIKNIRRRTVIALLFPLLKFLIFLFRIMPISAVRKLAVISGKKFYHYSHRCREIALSNINRVYGKSLSSAEQVKLAKQVFIEALMGFFDYMAYSHVKDQKRYFKLIEVEGEEHLKAAYERGRGVICLIPHLSSWEFAAITPPMLGYNTYAASKAMRSQLIEKLIVGMRARRGMKNISRNGSYQRLVEVLNEGNCLIIMTDQDTMVKGDFIDFLGVPAYTPFGASRLHMETEAALVPMAMTRKEDGNYCFKIYPELPLVKTGHIPKDLIENTKNQNEMYSKIIRTYPSQWVWMHRRWKTTPQKLQEYLEDRKRQKAEKARKNAARSLDVIPDIKQMSKVG